MADTKASKAGRTRKPVTHDERFTARIPNQDKALLQRAADRSGLSLSAYVFSKARSAAIEDLAEAGEIVLSERDRQRFVGLLVDPPTPSPELRRVLRVAEGPPRT